MLAPEAISPSIYATCAYCARLEHTRATARPECVQAVPRSGPCQMLNYTIPYYTALNYTTLHYITLHDTTLHYTTLHYTIYLLRAARLPDNHTTLHYTKLYDTYIILYISSRAERPPGAPTGRTCEAGASGRRGGRQPTPRATAATRRRSPPRRALPPPPCPTPRLGPASTHVLTLTVVRRAPPTPNLLPRLNPGVALPLALTLAPVLISTLRHSPLP